MCFWLFIGVFTWCSLKSLIFAPIMGCFWPQTAALVSLTTDEVMTAEKSSSQSTHLHATEIPRSLGSVTSSQYKFGVSSIDYLPDFGRWGFHSEDRRYCNWGISRCSNNRWQIATSSRWPSISPPASLPFHILLSFNACSMTGRYIWTHTHSGFHLLLHTHTVDGWY